MWTYPWDVQDLGYERVEADLRDRAGLDMISLATSYHAGRFLQPRSPVRKAYFPDDGTIYFRPDPKRWDGAAIQPKVADVIAGGDDVLAELIRRRDRGGLAVGCWTVCLHNTRIGTLHPEAVTRNAFGDLNPYALCPSSPAARDYVRRLVADVSHGYRPDRIELETTGFMGFAHEHHHEKDGVGLNPEDDFLMSLCFCDHCLTAAARSGIDGGSARETVRGFVADACERAVPRAVFPDFPACGPDAFRSWPELHAYVLRRFETVTSLAADLREATHPDTRLLIIDISDGWVGGCDLAALASVTDGAILCAYDMAPDAVSGLIADGRARVGPDKFLGTGFRLFYPEMKGRDDVQSRVAAAAGAGVDGGNVDNYGLVPAARLDWARP
jgi:hypothetical protein